MTDNSLFISDLHLAPERPEIIRLFQKFVDDIAIQADVLYILGDFLEYWIGDDDKAAGLQPVFNALDHLHQSGTRVRFMHGNRDFLVGKKLASRHYFEIIDDPCIAHMNHQPVLLMHGDLLCTDDIAYQNFRAKVRNRFYQRLFLLLPLSLRERVARSLRDTSEKATSDKSAEIMDVNQHAVENIMREFKTKVLIHGQTHRPGIHEFELDGQKVKRVVLGDWYQHGNYLRTNADMEFELVEFS
ncbi:MAG: UDP-2,3-diacylglucosamine diphosphatase [Gammaproteobacteria bacterium]